MKILKQFTEYLKKYEILVASSLVLLAVIALAFFTLPPMVMKTYQIISDGNKLRSRYNNLKSKNNTLSNMDTSYYRKIYAVLNAIIPESKDYVSLFNEFENLENKTGVVVYKTDFQLGIISTSSAKLRRDSSGAYEIPVVMSIKGSTDSIEQFLAALHNLDNRLITVENISWSKKDTITANITGITYYSPALSRLSGIDTPLTEPQASVKKLLAALYDINLPQEDLKPIEQPNVGKTNLFR